MQGDDWLNNASTRDAFGSYLENMLEQDARRELARVQVCCTEKGIDWRGILRVGEPAQVVLEVAAEAAADLVVIGPPRRKGEEGLRCRMDIEQLVRGLSCPLLIAPRA